MITNKRIVKDIFTRGECVNIQINNDPNPLSEDLLFVDPRAITEDALEKKILVKFGLREWTKIKVEGAIDTYCPTDIAEELKQNKEMLLEFIRQNGMY